MNSHALNPASVEYICDSLFNDVEELIIEEFIILMRCARVR
jgi:hypothetical protein